MTYTIGVNCLCIRSMYMYCQQVQVCFTHILKRLTKKEAMTCVHCFITLYTTSLTWMRRLTVFCDSCGGQNKNFTMIRFLHHLVHVQNRFEQIKVWFPIRGHLYMEPDKNMGLVKQKTRVELPSEWADVFREARVKPRPFDVVEVDQTMFKEWKAHLSTRYVKVSF